MREDGVGAGEREVRAQGGAFGAGEGVVEGVGGERGGECEGEEGAEVGGVGAIGGGGGAGTAVDVVVLSAYPFGVENVFEDGFSLRVGLGLG